MCNLCGIIRDEVAIVSENARTEASQRFVRARPFFNEALFTCACNSLEHQALFAYDPEEISEDWVELWIEIHLSSLVSLPENRIGQWLVWHLPVCLVEFFSRVWRGTKYILGHHSRFGHWDEICLTPGQVRELREFLDGFLIAVERAGLSTKAL